MKIAMLGGTFNPVHLGHLCLADDVRSSFDYEKIVFVPSNIPAHKEIEDKILSVANTDPWMKEHLPVFSTANYGRDDIVRIHEFVLLIRPISPLLC